MKHEKHMQKEIDRKVPSRSPISVVLRAYRPSDCSEVLRLFYDTVHTVNARDYTEEQLDAGRTENRMRLNGTNRSAPTSAWRRRQTGFWQALAT